MKRERGAGVHTSPKDREAGTGGGVLHGGFERSPQQVQPVRHRLRPALRRWSRTRSRQPLSTRVTVRVNFILFEFGTIEDVSVPACVPSQDVRAH